MFQRYPGTKWQAATSQAVPRVANRSARAMFDAARRALGEQRRVLEPVNGIIGVTFIVEMEATGQRDGATRPSPSLSSAHR